MKKMYVISHVYDVDGGFGDAISTERAIGIVATEEEAKEYANKWNNDHVYDVPYADLHCGGIVWSEIPVIDDVNLPPFNYNPSVDWAFDKDCNYYSDASKYMNQEEE